MGGDDYTSWKGRTEERADYASAGPLNRLSATLDRDDAPFANGDNLPPLAHWLYFLPDEKQRDIGADGHAKRGGFLPPIHDLPRRMWAGSRISFPGKLRVGEEIVRRSTIANVALKEGSTGKLAFVTVRHEISPRGGDVAIIDEHDIVYRALQPAGATREPPTAERGEWSRSITPDPVLLFRYSALTFNGHRIHYDRDYTTGVEGYPGLVVHGPLIATLLLDLVRRFAPDRQIIAYTFRAVSPLFDGGEARLNGTPPDADGVVKLWANDANDRVTMTAEATLR